MEPLALMLFGESMISPFSSARFRPPIAHPLRHRATKKTAELLEINIPNSSARNALKWRPVGSVPSIRTALPPPGCKARQCIRIQTQRRALQDLSAQVPLLI
jgi:hypothetical protein